MSGKEKTIYLGINMSNYSGKTEFEFEIERVQNIHTKEYFPLDSDLDSASFTYATINLMIKGSSYYSRGRYYGPPENCYPDEGETEFESAIGPDGEDWKDKLTGSEQDTIMEMIEENVQEGMDDSDPSDYDE
jgi:hypothetical protein